MAANQEEGKSVLVCGRGKVEANSDRDTSKCSYSLTYLGTGFENRDERWQSD